MSFKIAAIATEYRLHSHADVIISRWLEPRPTDSLYQWGPPCTQIASMHLLQIPENDLSAEISRKYGVPCFPSIREALTLGGDQLAVDAVLLIGEHGDYPLNDLLQKLYPRKEMFDEVAAVFRESGRSVPVFFDKHLSWNPALAHEMYWTVRDLEIPFFGGSSIPQMALSDAVDLTNSREIVLAYWDSLEPYLFHSLELMQANIETRPVADPALRMPERITAWRGEGVWKALEKGVFSAGLLEAAIVKLAPEDGKEKFSALREARDETVCAFCIRYRDGLQVTHFWHKSLAKGWAFAADTPGGVAVTRAMPGGGVEHFFGNFAVLNRKIEDFFLSGQPPVPLERLYLTTMETAACMQALGRNGEELLTDWIQYPVPRELPAPKQ